MSIKEKTMTEFNARIEYETREDIFDDLIAALADYHPAIARSERGWVEAHITLPADTLRQAVTTALAISEAASGVPILAIEVLPTAEFDARVDLVEVPELVSVTDAAELLGVSRSAVLQRLESGSLPGTKVGKTWVIQMNALTRAVQLHDETGKPVARIRTLATEEITYEGKVYKKTGGGRSVLGDDIVPSYAPLGSGIGTA